MGPKQKDKLKKPSKKKKGPMRWVDRSITGKKNYIRCQRYMETVSKEYTPETCLAMMKKVCEERNKALQGI